MRVLACLLLFSILGLAQTGEIRLTLYSGGEYIKASQCECSVKLLIGDRDSGAKYDYGKGRFEARYGTYTLVVDAMGFTRYERKIRVHEPQVDLLVGLELAPIADYAGPRSLPRIEGRILAENADFSSLWVRVWPVFRPDGVTFDSRVDRRGRFSIVLYDPTDSHSTKYVLLVLRPKRASTSLNVVATREVDVVNYSTANIEIVLE